MPSKEYDNLLTQAMSGNIHAFQSLFQRFHEELKSYLYRLTANRADAEDISHDTFIKAFDQLSSFQGKSSLKTWVFSIATNHARNELKKRKRWVEDVKTQSKEMVQAVPALADQIMRVNDTSAYGRFEIKEHIDTCFTCMAKTLPIENQIAIILKDIYDFSISEIMTILDRTEGTTKYLVQNARNTLNDIFERRCAFVNKAGVCNQCSELNGWLNPRQNVQEEKMKIRMIRDAKKVGAEKLFKLRINLVKSINPLNSDGNELQETLLRCNRLVVGEEQLTD